MINNLVVLHMHLHYSIMQSKCYFKGIEHRTIHTDCGKTIKCSPRDYDYKDRLHHRVCPQCSKKPYSKSSHVEIIGTKGTNRECYAKNMQQEYVTRGNAITNVLQNNLRDIAELTPLPH